MWRKTTVLCEISGCGAPARRKIAAPWSDGRFAELKTYGFACVDHVPDVCRLAAMRWLDYEPVKDEQVHRIGIFRLDEGKPDRLLVRDRDMEEAFLV
jgi:hypothetical protein